LLTDTRSVVAAADAGKDDAATNKAAIAVVGVLQVMRAPPALGDLRRRA